MTVTARKKPNGNGEHHEYVQPPVYVAAPQPAPVAPTLLDRNTNLMLPAAMFVSFMVAVAIGVATTTWQVGGFIRNVETQFERADSRMKALESRMERDQAATLDKLNNMTAALQTATSTNISATETLRGRVTHNDLDAWCRTLKDGNPKLSIKCPALTATR